MLIKRLIFFEPTAPPPHLLMVHPARTKAGSSLASTLCAKARMIPWRVKR